MVYGVNERSSERDKIINRLIEQQFSYKMENYGSSNHKRNKKKKNEKTERGESSRKIVCNRFEDSLLMHCSIWLTYS